LEQKRALANGKFRFGADAEKVRRFLFKPVVVIALYLLERRPLLAFVTNKLPFVFANRALRGRLRRLVKLRSALHADNIFHRAMTLPHRAAAI